MRAYIKKQILQILDSLKEANTVLKNLIHCGEEEELLSILHNQQLAAVEIGEAIERSEGENHQAVALLEEYCEVLWQMSQETDKNCRIGMYCRLKDLLFQILQRINRIQVVHAVAFFPYKASMWDSFESIWMAAREDDQCQCYVVPVPYFDKSKDGRFTEMHYEGGLFPCEVPVTDYKEFNLDAVHPEVIFFHNPYDQNNFVTSVHPAYYSSELKKHTELLVYVPYFVGLEDVREEVCIARGIFYADKVIVQSEKVRQTYRRVFKDTMQEQQAEQDRRKQAALDQAIERISDQKFVSLGSPKCDRIIHAKRENYPLPEAFERVIGKGEKRKKVIVYNTSIDFFLKKPAPYLEKMSGVLQLFSEREDAVLWWRPHPLMESSIAAEYPELLPRYLTLVDDFKKSGKGIYDESFDLDGAMAHADALYGDLSSVAMLYGLTGKPFLFQSMQPIEADRELRRRLWMDDMAVIGNTGWFSANNFNGLFQMDLTTRELTFVGRFPEEEMQTQRLYAGVAVCRNKLVFAPMAAKSIAVFDLEKKSFTLVLIDRKKLPPEETYSPFIKFLSIYSYGQWVFLFGCSCPAVIRLDVETGEIRYFTDWRFEHQKYLLDSNDIFFTLEGYQDGSKLYKPFCNANVIFEMGLDTCEVQLHPIEGCRHGLIGIAFDGERFWMAPRTEGAIVSWNPDSKQVCFFDRYPEGYVAGAWPGYCIKFVQGELLAFPGSANQILKIDPKTGEISCIAQLELQFMGEYPFRYVYCRQLPEGTLEFLRFYDLTMVQVGLDGVERKICRVVMPLETFKKEITNMADFWKEHRKMEMVWYQYIYWDDLFGDVFAFMDAFIDAIVSGEIRPEQRQTKEFARLAENTDGSAGEKIYHYIIRCLKQK